MIDRSGPGESPVGDICSHGVVVAQVPSKHLGRVQIPLIAPADDSAIRKGHVGYSELLVPRGREGGSD